jgi:hypothetical protein
MRIMRKISDRRPDICPFGHGHPGYEFISESTRDDVVNIFHDTVICAFTPPFIGGFLIPVDGDEDGYQTG